jgi:hypothetical protein
VAEQPSQPPDPCAYSYDPSISLKGKGDIARAKILLQASLTLSQTLGYKEGVAEALESLGAVAGGQGRSERALRLWASAEALYEAIGKTYSPTDDPRNERTLRTLRVQLSDGAFAAAWAAGRALPLEQAIAEALDR